MAGAQNGFPPPDEIVELVKIKVRKFTQGKRIAQEDFDELVQKLVLQLLMQLPRFNRSRAAARTFIDRVLESKGATIMEAQSAEKRRMLDRALSLDAVVSNEDGEESTLAETYSQDDYFHATGFGSPAGPAAFDTRIDVESALQELDREMRLLAERLKVMTPAEIESRFKIPHATLHDRIRKLGRLLAEAGLADYAPTPSQKTPGRPDKFQIDPVCAE